MLPLLLLAFIVVPIVELAVILEVGGYLGVWPTIAILVADSVAGAVLVKREGRRAWEAFRNAVSEARWPGDEVTQGALVLIGGALLLTPGFVTDVVGLLAVIPPTRGLASRLIRRRLTPEPFRDARGRDRGRRGDTIDVEVVSIDREDGRGDRGSERDQVGSGPEGPSADDPSGTGTDRPPNP